MENCEMCGEFTRVNIHGVCGYCELAEEFETMMSYGPEDDVFQEID